MNHQVVLIQSIVVHYGKDYLKDKKNVVRKKCFLRKWIRSMKKDRTILLSTHFLEEADALCDRIVVLVNGEIKENNCSYHVKRIYGTGYKLILNKNRSMKDFNLLKIIEKSCRNYEIESETKNELIIQTNEQSSKSLINLFKELDRLKENDFIVNYSLSNTSLGKE